MPTSPVVGVVRGSTGSCAAVDPFSLCVPLTMTTYLLLSWDLSLVSGLWPLHHGTGLVLIHAHSWRGCCPHTPKLQQAPVDRGTRGCSPSRLTGGPVRQQVVCSQVLTLLRIRPPNQFLFTAFVFRPTQACSVWSSTPTRTCPSTQKR